MNTTIELSDSIYAKLLTTSLPRPIRTDAELERFTSILLELDERDDRQSHLQQEPDDRAVGRWHRDERPQD